MTEKGKVTRKKQNQGSLATKHMNNNSYRLQCRDRELDLTGRTKIMGILNTTPDSFFDGGAFTIKNDSQAIDLAVSKAMAMISDGADIIDIGGESTRPGAETVDAEEEIRRTIPVIRELRRQSDILISIDTYKSAVAEQAILAGAQIVNDISGLGFDPAMAEICRHHQTGVILMHTTGRPESMKWSHHINSRTSDIVSVVTAALSALLKNAQTHGLQNIILDPGFGFGKTVDENYSLLSELRAFHTLDRPLLCGLSRKSFLGKALQRSEESLPPPENRLTATIAANTIAALNGTNILRVHDIKEAAEALAVTWRVTDS